MRYTTIDTIFSKIHRDYGFKDLPRDSVIEWIAESLDEIGVAMHSKETLAYINVSNYQSVVPNDAITLLQLLRDNQQVTEEELNVVNSDYMYSLSVDMVRWNKEYGFSYDEATPFSLEYTLYIDGAQRTFTYDGEISNDVGVNQEFIIYEGTYPVLNNYNNSYTKELTFGDDSYSINTVNENALKPELSDFNFIIGSGNINSSRFQPIYMSDTHFFNVSEFDDKNLTTWWTNRDSRLEYKILDDGNIRFNFEEGRVLLAYLKYALDEDNLPLIPDDVKIIEAITHDIVKRKVYRDVIYQREGSVTVYDNVKRERNIAMNKAKASWKMPKTIDQLENIANIHVRLIPRSNSYKNFFQQMSKEERLEGRNVHRKY